MAQLLGDLSCCTVKYLSNRFLENVLLVSQVILTNQYQFTTELMNIYK